MSGAAGVPSAGAPVAGRSDAMPATAAAYRAHGCHTCGLVSQEAAPREALMRCPRCGENLHRRRRSSVQLTMAYLLGAVALYIPANMLPMMSTTSVLGRGSHTILGGIAELWHTGSAELAVIVFVASILVPLLKIGVLSLLAFTAARRSSWRQLERARLFRMVEAVGHWSMLDVYVVVLLVGMVRFGTLASVRPEPGLLAFGAVVLLTMLASQSFDARLIWPEENDDA